MPPKTKRMLSCNLRFKKDALNLTNVIRAIPSRDTPNIVLGEFLSLLHSECPVVGDMCKTFETDEYFEFLEKICGNVKDPFSRENFVVTGEKLFGHLESLIPTMRLKDSPKKTVYEVMRVGYVCFLEKGVEELNKLLTELGCHYEFDDYIRDVFRFIMSFNVHPVVPILHESMRHTSAYAAHSIERLRLLRDEFSSRLSSSDLIKRDVAQKAIENFGAIEIDALNPQLKLLSEMVVEISQTIDNDFFNDHKFGDQLSFMNLAREDLLNEIYAIFNFYVKGFGSIQEKHDDTFGKVKFVPVCSGPLAYESDSESSSKRPRIDEDDDFDLGLYDDVMAAAEDG